jgi:glycosyltransferase involved in cell wall biosynthesis
MRIVIVVAGPEIIGGHSVQAEALVTGLRTDGYEVTVVPVNAPVPRGLRWLRSFRFLRTLLNEALYLPSLRRLARADVVHVFCASYWSFVLGPLPAIVAARAIGARVVVHYHSGEADDHLSRWGALVHPWLRLATHIVVPSRYLADVFRRHGYRTRVVRNIIDTSRFRYRDRMPLRPRLLSARNLEPHYRVNCILEAFAKVQRQVPGATLVIAGSGREEQTLRAHARALGITPDFVGAITPTRMPEIYEAADIFLNASVIDNQPVSILEAYASGLPVISTGTGDIAAMLGDGEMGTLVPPDDPAAMAEAIVALLRAPAPAVERARRASEETRHYSWSHVRGLWREIYTTSATPA